MPRGGASGHNICDKDATILRAVAYRAEFRLVGGSHLYQKGSSAGVTNSLHIVAYVRETIQTVTVIMHFRHLLLSTNAPP